MKLRPANINITRENVARQFGVHTGTKTAVELAVTRPDLVRRVVLHAPTVFNEQELQALRTRDSAIHSPNDDGSHVMIRWNRRQENLACARIVLRERILRAFTRGAAKALSRPPPAQP